MKTITINVTLTPKQQEDLQRHVSQYRTTEVGDEPGEIRSKPVYPTVAAFLQDQFYSSIAHVIGQPIEGEAADLQKQADALQKKARLAHVSMIQITEGDK